MKNIYILTSFIALASILTIIKMTDSENNLKNISKNWKVINTYQNNVESLFNQNVQHQNNVESLFNQNVQQLAQIKRKYQNLHKQQQQQQQTPHITALDEKKIPENFVQQQQITGVLQDNFITDFFSDIWNSITGFFKGIWKSIVDFFTSDLFITIMEGIGIAILCIIGFIILIYLIKLCGFQAAGVLAQSCASICQGLFYGGKIAANGLFSCFQSIGALGLRIFTTPKGMIIFGVSLGIGLIFTLVSLFLV